MGARAVASTSIAFGMVNIPVKLYTTAAEKQVKFSYLTRDGHRVKQQYIDEETRDVVERSDLIRGYEYEKGKFVKFLPEELKALEDENSNINIKQFVPSSTVPSVYVEASYYINLDDKFGGDQAFQLLFAAMNKRDVAAIATFVSRGKEHLCMIRPYGDGMMLNYLYFSDEVRDYSCNSKKFDFSEREIKLASKLIDQLYSDEFNAEDYTDRYSERVREVAAKKAAGDDVTITVDTEKKTAVDLFAALEASLSGDKPKSKKKTSRRKRTMEDDLARFDGLPPYDDPSNTSRGDGYFQKDMEKRYKMSIDKIRAKVTSKKKAS